MAKITRISTTITARYSPASGATDGFWIDGRISGPRESRAADISLDREDKAFFFATFATQSSGDNKKDIEMVKPVLDRTTLEIKHSSKNIDNQITDIAECSVGVAGRLSLQHEGVRQPFFAGIMVKDSEVAAVTMGRGCAYLYRNDTLYPLTKDDIPFEAIDYSGKSVPNIDIYCAGVAGTVRYSNIAQLMVDDCIIVCNREVMESIGQREMLRILYEANDQCEAAGLVITEAASKVPGTPIQFMIGFVESISNGERATKSAVAAFPLMGKPSGAQAKKDTSNAKAPVNAEDGDYEQEEDYDQYPDDEDENDERANGKSKKIALIAIIVIVILVCAFAVYTMINGNRGKNPLELTPTPTQIVSSTDSGTSTSIDSSANSDTTSQVTKAPTPTTPANVTPTKPATNVLPTTHTIAPGELLTTIAKKYYNSTDMKYINAIVAANKAKYPSFTTATYQQGWDITIPKVN